MVLITKYQFYNSHMIRYWDIHLGGVNVLSVRSQYDVLFYGQTGEHCSLLNYYHPTDGVVIIINTLTDIYFMDIL